MTQWGARYGLEVEPILSLVETTPERAEFLELRTAQEALTNVARHADAQRVRVELFEDEDSIVLRVEDDGCGRPADTSLVSG